MQRKSMGPAEIKSESEGRVTAVFATLGVKDKDGDVTRPGAFKSGQDVVISAYGHKSWEGALPVGKGVIREVGNQAVCEMQFFMNTTAGRDTFEAVKALGSLQQFSYGYNVEASELGDHEGKSVRFLDSLDVYEVSPVLVGAGEGTRVLNAKANRPGSEPDGSYPIETAKDVRDAVDDYNRSNGTPTDKAHIIARARAIGAESALPDGWISGKSLNDEISFAAAVARDAIKSAERVAALRAEQGKSLSNRNRISLDGLKAALTELDALLTEETETKDAHAAELEQLWLASVAADLESE